MGEAGCLTGRPLEHSTVSKVGERRSGGQNGDTQSTHMYGVPTMHQAGPSAFARSGHSHQLRTGLHLQAASSGPNAHRPATER